MVKSLKCSVVAPSASPTELCCCPGVSYTAVWVTRPARVVLTHRLTLDHLHQPEEAVAVVRETKSIEGAKMIARLVVTYVCGVHSM